MKKKLFTLLTLLVAVCSGAWAAELCSAALPNFNADGSTYGRSSGSLTGTNCTLAWKSINSANVEVGSVIYWKFDSSTYAQLTLTSGSFQAGDILTVNMYNQASKQKEIGYTLKSTSGNVAKQNVAAQTVVNISYTLKAEDIDEDGSIKIYRGGSAASDARFYSFSVSGTRTPAGPSITTQPVGASYVSGATINPLTVVATGTGTLTYQWYKNTTNEATIDNDHIISGATADSYTPTEAGFYYVVVTDDNGSVTSDVVEIIVSVATAASITAQPASGTATIGVEKTLSVEATGVPATFTYQWFECDDAEKTNPQEVGENSDTYSFTPTAAGDRFFYVTVSNGVGDPAVSNVATISVSLPQLATPTVTPANGTKFISKKTVKVSDPVEGATYKYSTDNGNTWADLSSDGQEFTETTTVMVKGTKTNYTDSEIVTISITKLDITLEEQTEVTEGKTWDWSKFGKKEIKLDVNTAPEKEEEFVLSNIKDANLGNYTIPEAFGDAQALKVKAEYVVRETKFFQGGQINFKTTIPGNVEVKYTNTGNRTSEDDRRFLNVNGTNYGEGTMSSKEENMVTTSVPVAIGEVTIKGTLKKDNSDQYLRIYSITFTPTATTTVGAKGYATYCNSDYALDFSNKSIKAYTISSTDGQKLTLTNKNKVAKGEPVLLYSETANDSQTIPAIAESEATATDGNKLVAGTGAEITWSDTNKLYILYTGGDVPGFYAANHSVVAVGKAYLDLSGLATTARSFSFDLNEGETTGIAEMEAVKNVENGKFYNLNGQQVAQPTKGMYIVNGKKYIIK